MNAWDVLARLRAFSSFLIFAASLLLMPEIALALGNASVTVISSADPSTVGQIVTITATVSPVAPATATPTGTITFSDGSNTLGAVTLSKGQGVYVTATLASGLHAITATYGGDGNFGSASGLLDQFVGLAGNALDWGDNANGQLGNNTTTDSSVPVQVSGLSGVVAIAGSGFHSLALKSDGTVWAWGDNANGQLGNDTTTDSSVPVQVSDLSGVVAVSGGANHSLALRSDGTVWAWGDNGNGQLGNNSTNDSFVPVQVEDPTGASYLSGIIAVSGGWSHSLALRSDGTVWAWGYDANGQLGNNSTSQSNLPVEVLDSMGTSDLSGVIAVAAGAYFSVVLKNDGTVWAWGFNTYGELGIGTTTDSHVPVQVSGLSGVIAIAGGDWDIMALKNDGTVWAWGWNDDGELGNNTTTQGHVPSQVEDPTGTTFLTGVAAVAEGYNSSLAMRSDGTVWAWGYNGNGQLGNNSTTNISLPVQVMDSTGTGYLTGVVAVAGGENDSLALAGYPVPSVALTSSQNPTWAGQPITFTAAVAAMPPATGTPTGTITFLEGTTLIGTQTLSDGVAAISIPKLSLGSYIITASYSGDSNFNSATSTLTQGVVTWVPLSAVPAPDGKAHLLWGDGTGRADLRILASDGSIASDVSFGPYPGWQALALSVAPDNSNHILWQYIDGTISIWKIDEAGDASSLKYTLYGPYAGWSPLGISTASDSSDRLLWSYDVNTVSAWRIDSSGTLTYRVFGPYAGWTPVAIAAAPDLSDHVLWKYAENTMSDWRIDPSWTVTYRILGPYPGWTPVSIGVDANLSDQILWNFADGTMSMWNLSSAPIGSYHLYGPYPKWSAATVNVGPADGDDTVMWTYPDGSLAVWNISSPGVFTYNIQAPPAD